MAGADFDSIGRPVEFPFDTVETFVLTVPTDRIFEIFAVAPLWLSSGNAGDREVQVRIANREGDILFRRNSSRVQPANEAIRYVWAPGMPDETTLAGGDQLLQPMPLLTIGEAGSVTIIDFAGIDAADALRGSISARVYKAS